MNKRCTPEMLGLVLVNGDESGTRFRDNRGREIKAWESPCGSGLHIDPFMPSWLSRCEHCGCHISNGTFELVTSCIAAARKLGFDAWMCNNDPRHGGWVQYNKPVHQSVKRGLNEKSMS